MELKVINPKNVVGYWDFDNVVGGKIVDKSGNDNQSIIKGGILTEESVQIDYRYSYPSEERWKVHLFRT